MQRKFGSAPEQALPPDAPPRCGVAPVLLSVFIAGILALKVAEGWLGLESFPLTNVSMFYERRPEDVVPIRARLFGVRRGETVELSWTDFRLNEDEFNTRLRDEEDLAKACSELVQSYNRKLERWGRLGERLTRAWAERVEVPRPGVPRRPWRSDAACAVEPVVAVPDVAPSDAERTAT